MRTTTNAASARAPTSAMAVVQRNPISGIGLVELKKKIEGGLLTRKPFWPRPESAERFVELATKECAFSQGEPADAIFYIQKGRVRLTVVSHHGKEATIALLGAGEFLGEDCIVSDHSARLATATAITPCTVLRIHKAEMVRALHQEHALSDMFVAFLLTRNARIQEDLVDHLFNSSEKRLARILLLLAHFGKPGKPETLIPKISQETLAEMIGTTRSRVSFFMNRFRKLGFIDYNGSSTDVHSSLLNVILHD